MFRSIRCVAIVAIALALTAPSGARAGFFNTATTSTTVPGGLGGGVLTSNLCGPVTPVIHALEVSVPPTGTGNSCTNDLQCSGEGEACTFPPGATSGTCMASGLLTRGDVSYVAGKLVDVEVTIPECTTISEVNGTTLLGQGGFDSTSSSTWSFLPYGTPTTVDGQPAIRERVRIQFPNFGDGQTSEMTIKVVAKSGIASTTRAFTIANVAAVNAAMRNTVSETQIRNSFVTRLYQKFGDYESVYDEDGERIAYGPDWGQLQEITTSQGQRIFRNSDIRILDGEIAVSTEFRGDIPGCDPTVSVYGWFTLVPRSDGYDFEWLGGPKASQHTGACAFLTLGIWEAIIDGLSDESELEEDFAASLGVGFKVDETGHYQICEGCRVKDVVVGNGKVDVWTIPPVERVRVNVATDRSVDATADPMRGLMLPAGMYAPITAGGSYESCQAADGQSPATCPDKFDVDTDGLFNWWGTDVPVPNPIVYAPDGGAAVLAGRQHAWARLLGLTRDVTLLPEKRFPAGSLLARRTPLNPLTPTTRARVSNGCVMPPNMQAPYRVSFGVNDIAVPATGAPPTSGKLDVTVLLAADASASQALFGGFETCTAAPSASPIVGTTTGTISLSR